VVRVSKLGSVMNVDSLKVVTSAGRAAIGFLATRHREGDQLYLLAEIQERGDCTRASSEDR
jgi:hypothetical protein